MPKRRMTPARKAAIAKWQKAGANARKAKALKANRAPVGKNVLLIHRTTSAAADNIVKEQRFYARYSGFRPRGALAAALKANARAFFTPVSSKAGNIYRGFGDAAVSVRVPRKLIKPDNYVEYKKYNAVTVSVKHLQGRKIRRHY